MMQTVCFFWCWGRYSVFLTPLRFTENPQLQRKHTCLASVATVTTNQNRSLCSLLSTAQGRIHATKPARSNVILKWRVRPESPYSIKTQQMTFSRETMIDITTKLETKIDKHIKFNIDFSMSLDQKESIPPAFFVL